MELQFKTRNYVELKKTLGADNLRTFLLKAAHSCDYEILFKALKQFSGEKNDAVENYVDAAEDKQLLFYEFIEDLGENGFFTRKTVEELRQESENPGVDMNQLIEQIAPEAVKEAMKSGMMTGANT